MFRNGGGESAIGQQDRKVVLFPKTVEYYRGELSRMLENDRFGEAARTLEQLIEMQIGEKSVLEEWEALYAYLSVLFPDGRLPESDDEEAELSEEELLAAHVAARYEANGTLPDKLLAAFEQRDQLERQIAALDQLRYVRHPEVGRTVRRWLTEQPLPHGVQFKALQLLKVIGEEGTIALSKQGQTYVLDIRETPADAKDFPAALNAVSERLQDMAPLRHPELVPFLEDTWHDFLAYAYGTPLYAALLAIDDELTDLWAGALHLSLLKAVHGYADANELMELYGITDSKRPVWQEACDSLSLFLLSGRPGLPM